MSIKSESIELPSPATVTVANQAEADARIPGALANGPCHLRIEGMEGKIDLTEWIYIDTDVVPGPDGCGIEIHIGKQILSVTVSGGEVPMHPDWVWKIRDDCEAAGVPFTLESWGEYCPISELTLELMRAHDATPFSSVSMLPNGRMDPDITREECQRLKTLPTLFFRVGRERSGRTLDGVVHEGETGRTVGRGDN